MRSGQRLSVLVVGPALAATLVLGLAGCNNSTDTGDSYVAPGGVPPAAPPPPPSAALPPPAVNVPPPSPGRPMTPSEKQYHNMCQAGTVQIGCELYGNDNALRLQGIDPNS